jgi:hypothetical protein
MEGVLVRRVGAPEAPRAEAQPVRAEHRRKHRRRR